MDQQGVDRQHDIVAGNSGPDGSLPPACPRFATRDEWEAWHGSLTWEHQLRRANLDPPEHEYSEADSAKARARDERQRAQRWDPDPFSYADDRRGGPWPRVDQLEAPTLSNTWRMDPASGYSPGGFGLRMRQVSYRELIEERLPARAQRDPEVRLAWLRGSIEEEEASLRAALQRVLRERHGRLPRDEGGATARAMAWSHLRAGRCQLRALRELVKAARAEPTRQRSQRALFWRIARPMREASEHQRREHLDPGSFPRASGSIGPVAVGETRPRGGRAGPHRASASLLTTHPMGGGRSALLAPPSTSWASSPVADVASCRCMIGAA